MVSIIVNRNNYHFLRTSKSFVSDCISTNRACNNVHQRASNVVGFRRGNVRSIYDYRWFPTELLLHKRFSKNRVAFRSFVNVLENHGISYANLELSVSRLYNDCVSSLSPFYTLYEPNASLYLRLIDSFSENQLAIILLQSNFEEEANIIFEYLQRVICLDPVYSRSYRITESISNDLFERCKLLTEKNQEDPKNFIHACINSLLFLSYDRSFSTIYWQQGSQFQQFLGLLRDSAASVHQPQPSLYKSIELFFYSILRTYALHKGFIPLVNSIDQCLPENMRIKQEELARVELFGMRISTSSQSVSLENFSDSRLLSSLYSGNYRALSEWLTKAFKEGTDVNIKILSLFLKGEPKMISLRDTLSLFLFLVKKDTHTGSFLEVKASLLSRLLRAKKLHEFHIVLSTTPNFQSLIEHRNYGVLFPVLDYITVKKDFDLFEELDNSLVNYGREIPEDLYIELLKCYGQMPKDVKFYKLFKAFLGKNPVLNENQKRYVNSILLESCHTHLSRVLYQEFPDVLRPSNSILFFCYCFRKKGHEWIRKYLNIAEYSKDDLRNGMITSSNASKTLLKAMCSKYDSSRAIDFLKTCSADGPYPSILLQEILHHAQTENNSESVQWLKFQEVFSQQSCEKEKKRTPVII
ncbi:cytochrome b translation regulator Cbp8 [Schizosaccharomyces osmophilus]|uniref:Cytochrome b translation regulator Cbp8 n=1 Tax=Schizosaccharomyces osmophilus TaxID=2545709 RepID=A0AAF0AXF8_9SCHI|nr:cytochrome b translation regulator Cbp8 [Schizosaccharomyces osmophilus]WBW73804.1 cytochrome b translation regulator Cbp8 [Schizosaccharomyces osmophilus]